MTREQAIAEAKALGENHDDLTAAQLARLNELEKIIDSNHN